jgi:hypothetical protein
MRKQILWLTLIAFVLGLTVPAVEAAAPPKPAAKAGPLLAKTSAAKKAKKHKKKKKKKKAPKKSRTKSKSKGKKE